MALVDVVFIAPLPAFRKRTRLAKMARVLRGQGLTLTLLGWERQLGELEEFRSDDPGISEQAILKGGGYASTRARVFYPLWMLAVFWCVLRLGPERILFCLGWETAFPARLATTFTGSRVVFDDADRFSMIVRFPGLAHRWLQGLERWTSRQAALHVIPSFSRYDWRHSRMVELANAPLLEDVERARSAPPDRPGPGFILYANGWIGETRGAPIFLKMLDLAVERGLDVGLIIAGHVTGESAQALIEHPRTHFIGEVSQEEALSLYASCDVLLTYYDPSVPINCKAESNKWGDAIFFGVPFIVNTEVETAAPFLAAGAAWSVPYADAEALMRLVENLMNDPDAIRRASDGLQTLRPSFPAFDESISRIFDSIR